jgi:hypothetical protein
MEWGWKMINWWIDKDLEGDSLVISEVSIPGIRLERLKNTTKNLSV